MLDKNEVLQGRESEIWFSGYAEGSKDAVSKFIGAATAYEEATPHEVVSPAYQKGYSAGIKYMYDEIISRLYEEKPEQALEHQRIIGVVKGALEVEKLDTDTDDFYKGYCDGISNAYECYELQPEHNCPYVAFGSCDRSEPCYGCEQCTEELSPLSEDYKKGYRAGYDKGSALWYESPFPSKQEDAWESMGRLLTQEELDKVLSSEEEDDDFGDEFFEHGCDVWYDKGYTEGLIQGKKMGFDRGYVEGQADMEKYNLVIDGEMLMRLLEHKQHILYYQKTPYNENREFNHALFDIHKGFINLIEDMILDRIFDFWHRVEDEDIDVDED